MDEYKFTKKQCAEIRRIISRIDKMSVVELNAEIDKWMKRNKKEIRNDGCPKN